MIEFVPQRVDPREYSPHVGRIWRYKQRNKLSNALVEKAAEIIVRIGDTVIETCERKIVRIGRRVGDNRIYQLARCFRLSVDLSAPRLE